MSSFVSPGVYVRELDFSGFAARQAGSVIAVVGTAGKGPVNKPVLLTSAGALTENFGKPLPTRGTRANFGLHAAYNALSQTPQVWYVRVTDGSERTAWANGGIVVNNQIVYEVDDDDGITIDGGQMVFSMQVLKKSGTMLKADAYAALVRAFGGKNLYDSSYQPINSLGDLDTAVNGGGAFVSVRVPMARDTSTWENLQQFISRFNTLMLGNVLRAESRIIEDDATGLQKYIVFKTQNLSDLLALNLQFLIVEAPGGFATGTLVNGSPAFDDVLITARQAGVIGNGITVTINDIGNTFTGLPPVSVSARNITVGINEGVTTVQEVLDALDESSAARLLVSAELAVTSPNGGGELAVTDSITLSGGGQNLPSEFAAPAGAYQSSTPTQYLPEDLSDPANEKVLRFTAPSPGEYANGATVQFGKDSFGLSAIEYVEGSERERAVELEIMPSGYRNSFIDFMPGFRNLGDFSVNDYTLLTTDSSLFLALGDNNTGSTPGSPIDVFGGGATVVPNTDREWLAWNAYEFYTAVSPVFEGGRSGIPEDYNDLVDAVIGNAADKTGIHAIGNRELYNNSLVAIPGFDQASVIRAGLLLSEGTGDMLYIADGPGSVNLDFGLNAQEIVDWHNGQGFGNSSAFNSSYGALYHSWVKINDPFNATDHWVPPSVVMLEQIAFSDSAGEIWFAPAGFKRGRLVRAQATQERAENNQGDRDYMYSGGNAVNPLVNFPREGIVVFGQRTLQRAPSALDRINVRRLLIYAKRISAATVRPELFEPNDPILWAQLQRLLNPIFNEIRAKRGLNNFLVKIDSSTTTNLNLDNSEVVGFIVLEPTKAAEKIILNFVITAQGASFGEALAAAGVA